MYVTQCIHHQLFFYFDNKQSSFCILQCYGGSQLWDTAFTVQAIVATGFIDEFAPTLKLAHNYIKNSQVYSTCLFVYQPTLTKIPVLSTENLPFALLWKVLEDCPGDLSYWYHHISKGGWSFSTADHGWPVSDCTAEGLKVIYVVSITSKQLYFEI